MRKPHPEADQHWLGPLGRRALRRIAVVLLGLLLLADAARLRESAGWSGGLLSGRRGTVEPARAWFWIRWNEAEPQAYVPRLGEEDSSDAFARGEYWRWDRRTGFWAPTHRVVRHDWIVRDLQTGRPLADAALAASLGRLCADAAVGSLYQDRVWLAELRQAASTGGFEEREILWSGVLHTALACCGLLVFLWLAPVECLRIARRMHRRVRAWLRLARMRRPSLRACAECGYDLSGHPDDRAVRCPECGLANRALTPVGD